MYISMYMRFIFLPKQNGRKNLCNTSRSSYIMNICPVHNITVVLRNSWCCTDAPINCWETRINPFSSDEWSSNDHLVKSKNKNLKFPPLFIKAGRTKNYIHIKQALYRFGLMESLAMGFIFFLQICNFKMLKLFSVIQVHKNPKIIQLIWCQSVNFI